jgi:hypothetical protein
MVAEGGTGICRKINSIWLETNNEALKHEELIRMDRLQLAKIEAAEISEELKRS